MEFTIADWFCGALAIAEKTYKLVHQSSETVGGKTTYRFRVLNKNNGEVHDVTFFQTREPA